MKNNNQIFHDVKQKKEKPKISNFLAGGVLVGLLGFASILIALPWIEPVIFWKIFCSVTVFTIACYVFLRAVVEVEKEVLNEHSKG